MISNTAANQAAGLTVGNTGAGATDRARKIVLFDNLASSNNFQYYGFGIGPGALKYQINDPLGNHIFYAGTSSSTEQELFRIDGSGNCTALNNIIGVPRYGVRYKPTNQQILAGFGRPSVTWTDQITGVLSSNGTAYTNNTSGTLIVQFNYTILWDPAIGGGGVGAFLVQGGPSYRHANYTQVFPTAFYATNQGSVIVTMAPTTTVEILVENGLGGPLSVKGGAFSSDIVSRMSYYILN